MTEKLQWICEACDSPNSVGAGESAVCRFCRLTYDVKIENRERVPDGAPRTPAVEAAVELMTFDSESDDEAESDE